MRRNLVIGSLIRGREWALPRFLDGIGNLDTTGFDVSTLLVVQGKIPTIVHDAVKSMPVKKIGIMQLPDPGVHVRTGRPWKFPQYVYMSYLRNILLREAYAMNASLFSVDSDIVLNTDTLQVLASAQADVASALVKNHPHSGIYNFMDAVNLDQDSPRTYVRDAKNSVEEMSDDVVWWECDMTGACVLIDVGLIGLDVMYRPHPQGEDCGFADSYKEICDEFDRGQNMVVNIKHQVAHQYAKDFDMWEG